MKSRLPNFVIVGAMKAGTTSLANYIAAHPDGYVPPQKEIYFFERDDLWAKGGRWYADQFARATDAVAVGEASPSYMYWPAAIDRMASVIPDAKLIAVLRDPVDRAYSHYLQWRFNKLREHRPFAAAVAAELSAGVQALGDYDATGNFDFSYLGRGLYRPQLEHVCERFPRDSLLVLLMDDLTDRPREVFVDVCRFLGMDSTIVPEAVGEVFNPFHFYRPAWLWRLLLERRERRRVPRRYELALMRRMVDNRAPEKIEPDVRERLSAFFAPYNADLGRWLGRDLTCWS